MKGYQQRVVKEKEELDSKIDKLIMFINSSKFASFGKDEQDRLIQQLHYMSRYTSILRDRIEDFT